MPRVCPLQLMATKVFPFQLSKESPLWTLEYSLEWYDELVFDDVMIGLILF